MDDNKTLIEQDAPIADIPDIDEATLKEVFGFIVSLIQALLRTGYYTSEHPESEKARAGLYTKFRQLTLKKSEFTFLIQEKAEKAHIIVEGMLPNSCDLRALMLAGMAELYDEKLIIFLERKELISLTLKQKMQEQEFYDFIEVMSKPILTDINDKHKRDRFTFFLQEKGISNISFVFNEDLISWERDIPWRAWIALSRLRKDISLIPILRNLDQKNLKKVKKEVVSDVLRPMQDPKLVFSTLVNSDLIHSKVMKEEEIEAYIVESFSDDMLFANVEEFVNSHSRLKKLVDEKAYEEKLLRILNGFKVRLKEFDNKKSHELLEKLHQNGLIAFDELPPRLKEEIFLKTFLKTFLNDPDSVLTRLDQMEDEKQYGSFVKSTARIMPRLIERDRFQEFLKILLVLEKHAKEGSKRGGQAKVFVEQIGSGGIPLQLKDKFMSGKKETRLALYPIFLNLESCITPHLLAVIDETEDQWVRKNATELLVQMGPSAGSYLEQALKAGKFRGEVVIDVVKTLVTMDNPEMKEKMTSLVNEYRHHQDPGLRKHALTLLAEVKGKGAEGALLNALNDSNLEVRKTAIKCLGIIKSEKALPVFMEVLKNTVESPSKDAEEIENQIYCAFGFMDNHLTHDDKTPEGILLEVLAHRAHTGTISRLLRKKGNTLSEAAICAICDSLARIGTEISESVLTELAKNKKKPWGIKAQQALEMIKRKYPKKNETKQRRGSTPGPRTVPPEPSGPVPEAIPHPTD
ncbi:MAG: HEAT repeat domain-containing protein [Desulfobacterales bacterium]|nr:MAG: HEAT repeat domain-containing protein [Desulfobacterales bacterium]